MRYKDIRSIAKLYVGMKCQNWVLKEDTIIYESIRKSKGRVYGKWKCKVL